MIAQNEFSQLIESEEITNYLKEKKDPCLYESIPKIRLAEYQSNGWEIQKEYKTKVRVKKKKLHGDYFEDRVWTLMAKLGFKYMNKDSKFKITYDEEQGLEQQIDVFAANDEVAIVIECKSADRLKNKDFSKDINELGNLREGIIKRIKKHFEGNLRIAFLFCTNNCIVNDPDQQRMKSSKILWLNQDDIRYFENLTYSIKKATIYQFLGRVFAQQKILNMKNLVPAVRGKMGGFSFYSFAVEPSILLQISYVLHRVQTTEETLNTYQRIVKPNRITEIQKFLDNDNFIPNAIILNIDTPKATPLQFDAVEKKNYDSKTQIGILHLPQNYHCAYVIDGQHRLYGYAGSKYKETNTIPVIAFENLPPEKQANLFVEINSKQKSVNKNLLTTLDAELRWDSPNKDDAIKALKSKLVQKLAEDQSSPLYNLISMGDDSSGERVNLTLSFLCTSGFAKTNLFGQLQKKTLTKRGYLCDKEDLAGLSLQKSFSYIKDALNLIKDRVPQQLFIKNVCIAALVRLFNDILQHLEINYNISCNTTSAKTLYEKSKEFLEILGDSLISAPASDIDRMSKYYGSGGPEKVLREFQRLINLKKPEFNPIGLEEYIKDSSGSHNEEVHKILLDFFKTCRDFIFDELQKASPESWWDDNIPRDVREKCAIARVRDNGHREDKYYLEEFSDLSKIIENNWKRLSAFFANPDSAGNRKEKLRWLNDFSKYHVRVNKPEQEPIKESEYQFILETVKRVYNNIKK